MNISNFMKDFNELKERKDALLRSKAIDDNYPSTVD